MIEIVNSNSCNAIAVLAIGSDHYKKWQKNSLPSLQIYCEKNKNIRIIHETNKKFYRFVIFMKFIFNFVQGLTISYLVKGLLCAFPHFLNTVFNNTVI